MRIVVVGCGYVGLVSGACFARMGHHVLCVDKDAARIGALAAGEIPIYEKGLRALVQVNAAAGRLAFAPALPALDAAVDAIFIAVGTPASADGSGADLAALAAAVEDIAKAASAPPLLVVKSTVPPGVCDAIEAVLRELRPDLPGEVVSNPEFLREGSALLDFLAPDRIVVGTRDGHPHAVLEALYAPLLANGAPLHWTTRRSAELIKHASNAFLATKIAFVNEIADLCERAGADVREVARGMGLDSRIGEAFLEAGPGYGGSCFPKDAAALLDTAARLGVTLGVLESTVAGNLARRKSLVRRVAAAMDDTVRGRRVAVLGLAFKAGTDDCRESPAIDLVRDLLAEGAEVSAFDPKAMPMAESLIPGARLAISPYDCVRDGDCLVLATPWPQLLALDPMRIGALMAARRAVDLRNGLDPEIWSRAGFALHGVGRVPERAEPVARMRPAPVRAERHAAAVN